MRNYSHFAIFLNTMAFVQVKKCLSDPKQLVKLVVLVICICITIYQLTGCVQKILQPPVSTYYKFHLNETIRYPAVTICRRPNYKTTLFPDYNMKEAGKLTFDKAFIAFPFENTTVAEFLEATTYDLQETIPMYGYGGKGLGDNVLKKSSYFINKGLCHTFIPKENSKTFSIGGGYFFYFKHTTKMKEKDMHGLSTSGFEIFMHDANQVLTGEDEEENSFMEYIYLEAAEDMHVSLTLETFSQISNKKDPCISDSDYSRSKCQETCVHNQIARKVGCTLPWLRELDREYPACSDFQSVRNLISGFNAWNRSIFLQNCDCKMSCNITVYNAQIQSRREADAIVGPGSTINIYFSSNLITTMEEVSGYDWNVFLADVGGSLGFLLGLSVIGVITVLEEVIHMLFRCRRKNNQPEVKKRPLDEDSLNKVLEFLADCEFYQKQLDDNQKKDNSDNVIKY